MYCIYNCPSWRPTWKKREILGWGWGDGGKYPSICRNIKAHIKQNKTIKQSLNVQWDSATYSYPCENTGTCKSSPTCFTDWPCDIFTVVANARWTGNWCHEKGSSKDWSDGLRVMCGIKTDDPANFPPSIQYCNTHGCISIKMSLVPLQSPIEGLRFWRSISGHPCLSFKYTNGSPDRTKEFRNSMGYTSKWSIDSSESDAQ